MKVEDNLPKRQGAVIKITSIIVGILVSILFFKAQFSYR